MTQPKNAARGAGFLVDHNGPDDVYTPEDFTDDQRQIGAAVAEFMKQAVAPQVIALEEHDYGLLKGLIRQAGDLGFLSVDLPESLGGLGFDLTTSALVFEEVGSCGSGSFAAAVGAHSGIGTWPLQYFGSDEQKRRFLPGIMSGEKVAAYALTESGSGSDALAAKCRASLTPDGQHYVVNGEKVFITNARIAGVFTVFVKIDGDDDKKACLVVESGTPGFSIDREEHKLGIRGSSTCRLVFENALVPVGNLLGEIGKGHKVVLNTLNLGRFKLGAAAAGAIKSTVRVAAEYAGERKQFGKPLLEFDGIRAKIAEMVIAGWVGESLVYRTAGLLSGRLHDADNPAAATKAIEEFTVECSLVKVALSEMLDGAADELLQILGGYGYIEEYPAARAYRDSRINRIFEGTNEINRMLIVGEVVKRDLQGRIDLVGAAKGRADISVSVRPPSVPRQVGAAKGRADISVSVRPPSVPRQVGAAKGQSGAAVKPGRRDLLAKGAATAKRLKSFAAYGLRRLADRLPVTVTARPPTVASGAAALRPTFEAVRTAVLYTLGESVLTLRLKLKDEQQVLFDLADLLMAVYAMESALLRYEKQVAKSGADATLAEAVVRAYFASARQEAEGKCLRVLAAMSQGAERAGKAARLVGFLAGVPLDDAVALKRAIGAAVAAQGKYPF